MDLVFHPAPPFSSTDCSDSLTAHHLQPQKFTVRRTNSKLPSCTRKTHYLGIPLQQPRRQDTLFVPPATGQQQRVTSSNGAVTSSPIPATQDSQPQPYGTINILHIICRPNPESSEKKGQVWMGVWGLPAPNDKTVEDQAFPRQTRE